MKITVITSPFLELPPIAIGAVEKLFYLLASEWLRLGHQVAFICCGGGQDERIKFIRLKKYERTGSTKKDLVWDFFYSIKALMKCPKTDILLCNTFWTPVLAPLFRWKYKKLVYGVHRYPKGQFWLYPFVHSFICVSTAVAADLRRQMKGVMQRQRRRVCTIVNPIDERIFNGNGRNMTIKGRVVYAGRVHPTKGLECLSKVCKRLYEEGLCTELFLIGTFDLAKGGGGEAFARQLRQIAKPCPVNVVGAISNPEELARFERSAEAFVYPSADANGEACPIAPMESMALGIPTIVSGLSCYDDYVQNGYNALKFETEDDHDLQRTLRLVLSSDELREKLIKRSVVISEIYSRKAVAQKYLKVFEKL